MFTTLTINIYNCSIFIVSWIRYVLLNSMLPEVMSNLISLFLKPLCWSFPSIVCGRASTSSSTSRFSLYLLLFEKLNSIVAWMNLWLLITLWMYSLNYILDSRLRAGKEIVLCLLTSWGCSDFFSDEAILNYLLNALFLSISIERCWMKNSNLRLFRL